MTNRIYAIRVHNLGNYLIVEKRVQNKRLARLVYNRGTGETLASIYNNLLPETNWLPIKLAMDLYAELNKVLEEEKPTAYY